MSQHQHTEVEAWKVTCDECGKIFYEFYTNPKCPHCGEEIEAENTGKWIGIEVKINMLTGIIESNYKEVEK